MGVMRYDVLCGHRLLLVTVLLLLSTCEIASFDIRKFLQDNNGGDSSELVKNLAKEKNQDSQQHHHHDASTGTVTDLPTHAKKEPTTCNAMMAEAVIHANDEKSRALAAKVAAIDNMKEVQKELVRCEVKSERCKEDMEKLEGEKSGWADLVSVEKEKSDMKVKEILEQKEKEIDVMKKDTELWRNETLKEAEDMVARERQDAQNVKEKSDEMVKTIKASNAAEMEALIANTTSQITSMQQKVEADVTAAETKARETISQIRDEAERNITAITTASRNEVTECQRLAAEEVLNATRETEQVRVEFEKARIEGEEAMTALRKSHAAELSQVQAEAEERLTLAVTKGEEKVKDVQRNASEVLGQVTTESEAVIKGLREDLRVAKAHGEKALEKLQKESEEVLEALRREGQKNLTMFEEQTSIMLRDMEREKQDTVDFMSKLMSEREDQDRMRLEEVKLEAKRKLARHREISEHEKMELEREKRIAEDEHRENVKSLKREHSKALSEKQKRIDVLEEELERLKAHVYKLNHNLTATSRSLQHWETKEVPYCNFTLIRQDTHRSLTKTLNTTARTAHTVKGEMAQRATSLAIDVAQWYEKCCAETVTETMKSTNSFIMDVLKGWGIDEFWRTSVLPYYQSTILVFYTKKVVPLLPRVVEYYDLVMKELKGIGMRAQKETGVLKGKIVKGLKLGVNSILKSMAKENEGFLVQGLQHLDHEAEAVVDYTLIALVLLGIYVLRAVIKAVLLWLIRIPFKVVLFGLWVLTLPLRVSWFFCPLRLLLPSRNKGPKGEPVAPKGKDGDITDQSSVEVQSAATNEESEDQRKTPQARSQ